VEGLGRMQRLSDWAFYVGLLCLGAAVAQQFALPAYGRFWWPLVAAGIVLVVLSALPRLDDLGGTADEIRGRLETLAERRPA